MKHLRGVLWLLWGALLLRGPVLEVTEVTRDGPPKSRIPSGKGWRGRRQGIQCGSRSYQRRTASGQLGENLRPGSLRPREFSWDGASPSPQTRSHPRDTATHGRHLWRRHGRSGRRPWGCRLERRQVSPGSRRLRAEEGVPRSANRLGVEQFSPLNRWRTQGPEQRTIASETKLTVSRRTAISGRVGGYTATRIQRIPEQGDWTTIAEPQGMAEDL